MTTPQYVLVPTPAQDDYFYYAYKGLQSELVEDSPAPPDNGPPPWIDLRDVMPYNPNPDHPQWPGGSDWATGAIVDAVTIHHVGVEAATLEGVAAWTTRTQARGGKGLPRLQYHFWVERNGAIKYCTDLRYSFWHDHGGYPSHHLSVVFAGRCDTTRPPRVQLEAAAHLTRWLLSEFVIDTVNGHREVSGGLTICPGWEHWEADFRESLSTPVSFAVQREVEMCVVQDLE